MTDLEYEENEIQAFLQGKPVSAQFIAELEEHTKALIEKLEVITKDLHRPGDDLLPKTQVNES